MYKYLTVQADHDPIEKKEEGDGGREKRRGEGGREGGKRWVREVEGKIVRKIERESENNMKPRLSSTNVTIVVLL